MERSGFCLSGRLAVLFSPGKKACAFIVSERDVGLTAWRGPVETDLVMAYAAESA
jgi:hypothetical protein